MKCKKNMESKSPNNVKNKNGKKKKMLLSKCAVCNSKKSKFIKEQTAKGLLSKLTGIKIPTLSDLPIVNILF